MPFFATDTSIIQWGQISKCKYFWSNLMLLGEEIQKIGIYLSLSRNVIFIVKKETQAVCQILMGGFMQNGDSLQNNSENDN